MKGRVGKANRRRQARKVGVIPKQAMNSAELDKLLVSLVQRLAQGLYGKSMTTKLALNEYRRLLEFQSMQRANDDDGAVQWQTPM